MSMGKRISRARKIKGYTQEYVACTLNVSRQAVYKWEKDQTRPDTANLIALSELLDISVDYLVKGTKIHHCPGEIYFRVSLFPLLLLPLCWLIGLLSGEYSDMVQIPIGNGDRIGLPFLLYGHSPAANILTTTSVVCLILFVILLILGKVSSKNSE